MLTAITTYIAHSHEVTIFEEPCDDFGPGGRMFTFKIDGQTNGAAFRSLAEATEAADRFCAPRRPRTGRRR